MYSYRIEQAIRAAAVLHHNQNRKGSMPYPFVTHLYSVAMLLTEFTKDEDTIIAALMHDTIEDTDYSLEELREDFGDNVALIVDTLSEKQMSNGVKQSWINRKKSYAKQLKNGPVEALMIAAADKTHNFRSTVEEYYSDYNRFLQDFGKNLDERIEAYQTIANVINNRLRGPLLTEFNHVFDEYKNFIYDIKKSQEYKF